MEKALRPLILLPFLVACGESQSIPRGQEHVLSSPIVGGTTDNGHDAVVLIYSDPQAGGEGYVCTGTLIDYRVVLTAGHCADLLAPEHVVTGSDPARPEQRLAVAEVIVHPWYERATLSHDLALVRVAGELAVTPAALPHRDLDVEDAGAQARVVGFGLLDAAADTALRKREGFSRIASIEQYRFRLDGEPSQPCLGDSGGPTFLRSDGREPLVGVHSGGSADCTGGSWETRIDAYLEFIDAYAVEPYGYAEAGGLASAGCGVAGGGGASGLAAPLLLALGCLGCRKRRARRTRCGRRHRQ